jgi:hypothetical protein
MQIYLDTLLCLTYALSLLMVKGIPISSREQQPWKAEYNNHQDAQCEDRNEVSNTYTYQGYTSM